MEKENTSASANDPDLILIAENSKQMRIVGEGKANWTFNP